MILSLWKQSESSVPTDLPKTERESPAFGLGCNPFQRPERPGRTCSCILHTLGCISCKNLVLPRSLSLGISLGLTVLVLALSTEKLVVAQSRNLTEVVKSWLLVGEIQGSSKICCYAVSFSPGNTHCPYAWRWRMFLSHERSWSCCCAGEMGDFTPYTNNDTDLRHPPKNQMSPGKKLPMSWRMHMFNNASNSKVSPVSSSPFLQQYLPLVSYLPRASSPMYPGLDFSMIQVKLKPWSRYVGDWMAAFYISVTPGSFIGKALKSVSLLPSLIK